MTESPVMRATADRTAPNLAGLDLTVIERRVIALTAAGRTLQEIGDELGMSFTAVKRHRLRIQEKLGALNAPNAVAIWLGRDALERLA